jgi:hypothetical protein
VNKVLVFLKHFVYTNVNFPVVYHDPLHCAQQPQVDVLQNAPFNAAEALFSLPAVLPAETVLFQGWNVLCATFCNFSLLLLNSCSELSKGNQTCYCGITKGEP